MPEADRLGLTVCPAVNGLAELGLASTIAFEWIFVAFAVVANIVINMTIANVHKLFVFISHSIVCC